MNFSKKAISLAGNPPGTGAADPRGIYRPLQIHRRGPHGAVRHPRQHHHGAGHPRVRLRQQLAIAAIEQPFRHQVQTQLDGRQGLLRRRRQGGVLPQLPLGRGVVQGPCRIPRFAATLRLAVRLLVRRLQELGTGAQSRRLRHGARLRAAAHAHHRGEPALPARPARRRAALRLAHGTQGNRFPTRAASNRFPDLRRPSTRTTTG